jgi:hypothetical protein
MIKILCCLTAFLSLACASCSNRIKIYPVSGKVTYEGRPAAGAAVFFHRHGGDTLNDPMIMGIVMQDGFFEVACGSLGKGAPVGEYDVLVEWKPRITPNGGQDRTADKLMGRFADLNHPVLHAKVEAEANQLPPFDLAGESRVP